MLSLLSCGKQIKKNKINNPLGQRIQCTCSLHPTFPYSPRADQSYLNLHMVMKWPKCRLCCFPWGILGCWRPPWGKGNLFICPRVSPSGHRGSIQTYTNVITGARLIWSVQADHNQERGLNMQALPILPPLQAQSFHPISSLFHSIPVLPPAFDYLPVSTGILHSTNICRKSQTSLQLHWLITLSQSASQHFCTSRTHAPLVQPSHRHICTYTKRRKSLFWWHSIFPMVMLGRDPWHWKRAWWALEVRHLNGKQNSCFFWSVSHLIWTDCQMGSKLLFYTIGLNPCF